MELVQFTDKEIRAYLLGSLPSESAEKIDELSFTDEYFERIGGIEHDLVDDYVQNELPADERYAFERLYLRSPMRRHRVAFSEALRTWAGREPSPPSLPETPDSKIPLFRGLRNWRRFVQFGLAPAAVLLAVIVGISIYRTGNRTEAEYAVVEPSAENSKSQPSTPEVSAVTVPKPADANPEEPPKSRELPTVNPKPAKVPATPADLRPKLATVFLSPVLRSTDFQSVKFPTGTSVIQFHLGLETGDSGPFTAEIMDLRVNTLVWSSRISRSVGSETRRTVGFRAPSSRFVSGDYRITISTIGAGGNSEKVGDYYFRVAP